VVVVVVVVAAAAVAVTVVVVVMVVVVCTYVMPSILTDPNIYVEYFANSPLNVPSPLTPQRRAPSIVLPSAPILPTAICHATPSPPPHTHTLSLTF